MKVKTYKADSSMFFGDNWCAKCEICGTVLTKYDETEEQARRLAESEACECDSHRQEVERGAV